MQTPKRTFGPVPSYPLALNYKPKKKEFIKIAGPCSVEDALQISEIAKIVKKNGCTHLRGGVFRAGTYSSNKHKFGWVDEQLMTAYRLAALENGLRNIIEVLDYSDESLEMINHYCDCFQVGARSQQNYSLLRKLGKFDKPVFLKRNTGCTVDEWLGSAEHLLNAGVEEIYLIERGSSTFHNDVRWTPTIHVIPSVKSMCEIPIIIDASHSTGRRDLVPSMTLAGIAAGADGFLVEVHTHPEKSLSDAEQAISPEVFEKLIKDIESIKSVIGGL